MSGSFGLLSPIGSVELLLQAFAGPANHHCVGDKGDVWQLINSVLQAIGKGRGGVVFSVVTWSGVLYVCHLTATCTVINPALPALLATCY